MVILFSAVISFLNIYNILSVDSQTSTLSVSNFDISECDKVTNVTLSREAVHGNITNYCLKGGEDHDILYNDLGYDILTGNKGDDELIGNSGSDKLYGDLGDDDLIGSLGDDLLDGGDGNDVLNGGNGDDKLIGGNGDDMLIGRLGTDLYICGPGNDIAVEINNLEVDRKTSDCEGVIR